MVATLSVPIRVGDQPMNSSISAPGCRSKARSAQWMWSLVSAVMFSGIGPMLLGIQCKAGPPKIRSHAVFKVFEA